MKRSKAFLEIKAGLEDALAYAKGDKSRGVAHTIPLTDARAVRGKLGLSRHEFSQRFGIPERTLQDWEQKRRTPDPSSRILLEVIDKHPRIVAKTVKGISKEGVVGKVSYPPRLSSQRSKQASSSRGPR